MYVHVVAMHLTKYLDETLQVIPLQEYSIIENAWLIQ